MFRARRVHDGLANEMVQSAAEQFLPALVVGSLLTAVVLRAAPKEAWMLPGLWQLLFSLGVFASCRFLPRLTFAVGIWYLICGIDDPGPAERIADAAAVDDGNSFRDRVNYSSPPFCNTAIESRDE